MPNGKISQIQVSGTTYDICDATARNSISQCTPTLIEGHTEIAGTTADADHLSEDLITVPFGVGLLTAIMEVPPAAGQRNIY